MVNKLRIWDSTFVLLNKSIRIFSIKAHPKNMMAEVSSIYGM